MFLMRRPNKKLIKSEKRKFREALVKGKKEFQQIETSIENKEKRLWKLFRPMKELGRKKLKKGKAKHLR